MCVIESVCVFVCLCAWVCVAGWLGSWVGCWVLGGWYGWWVSGCILDGCGFAYVLLFAGGGGGLKTYSTMSVTAITHQ